MDIWRLPRKEVCYEKLYSWITEHTGLVLVGFLILTVVCTALKPLIGVNYDMNDYLPPDRPEDRLGYEEHESVMI